MSEPIGIEIRNLYKIFGPRGADYVDAVNRGMTKAELNDRHRHVLGLRGINISIPAGAIQVVMGLSGSGKSTLIRHINRLIDPTAGQIVIEGQDVVGMTPEALRDFRRHKTAMVFQKFGLLPHRTVIENVGYGLEVQGVDGTARNKVAMRWIERVGLLGFEHKYPSQLSGGMQQRVGLARALANDAPILLMDEAYSALDPLIRTRLQDELLELQAKTQRTIIFVSHDLDEAFKLGNRIALMEGGRIVQIGTARDIIANPVSEYVADFVAHMNPLGVLTAADVVQPGPAAEDLGDDPVPRDMPVREVMGLLADRTALPVQGGGCITRDAVLARLIDPRG